MPRRSQPCGEDGWQGALDVQCGREREEPRAGTGLEVQEVKSSPFGVRCIESTERELDAPLQV